MSNYWDLTGRADVKLHWYFFWCCTYTLFLSRSLSLSLSFSLFTASLDPPFLPFSRYELYPYLCPPLPVPPFPWHCLYLFANIYYILFPLYPLSFFLSIRPNLCLLSPLHCLLCSSSLLSNFRYPLSIFHSPSTSRSVCLICVSTSPYLCCPNVFLTFIPPLVRFANASISIVAFNIKHDWERERETDRQTDRDR